MTETMTTEDALQAELDADPANHTLRMVLADYLEEVGDPRSEGYRVLGKLEVTSELTVMFDKPVRSFYFWGSWFNQNVQHVRWKDEHEGMLLPGKLMNMIPHKHDEDWDYHLGSDDSYACWRGYITRREADDAAALAWSKLTESEKAEILANPMSGM